MTYPITTTKLDSWTLDNNEKRKNEIVSKLQTIYSCAKLKQHEREWILQAKDYIRGQNNE